MKLDYGAFRRAYKAARIRRSHGRKEFGPQEQQYAAGEPESGRAFENRVLRRIESTAHFTSRTIQLTADEKMILSFDRAYMESRQHGRDCMCKGARQVLEDRLYYDWRDYRELFGPLANGAREVWDSERCTCFDDEGELMRLNWLASVTGIEKGRLYRMIRRIDDKIEAAEMLRIDLLIDIGQSNASRLLDILA